MRAILTTVAMSVLVMGFAPTRVVPEAAEVDALLVPLPVAPAAASEVDARCQAFLTKFADLRQRVETDKRPATIETAFLPFDAMFQLMSTGNFEMGLLSETHPAAPIRAAAESCSQKLADVASAAELSRPMYDRLSAIDASKADPAIAFSLKKRLVAFRQAGVDKDAATRARAEALQKEITATSLVFSRNLREIQGSAKFRPEELAGLPKDWLDAHKPGADGLITVTTDYPDFFPVMEFAEKPETRRRILREFDNRAWPQNEAVLKDLLAKRYELARTLGYANYATMVIEDKMIGSPQKAQAFIDKLDQAAKPAAVREKGELLAHLKTLDPAATQVNRWDSGYLTRLVRMQKYDVDSAVVRQYFTYGRTRDGLFKLVQDLYGVQIRPWKTPVWHESVGAYEIVENGKVIGRFYLDMHPREGKYGHAAAFPVRIGQAGRVVPISALICNFPAEGPMDHPDVETFFHEFGHLLHWIFAGQQPLAQQNFGQVEWDFVEAPSQMLEEWVWDYDTLRTFAVNDRGEAIPQALVTKMVAGRHFGEPAQWRGQATYAAISLNYYNRSPEGLDLTEVWKANYEKYGNYPYIPDTHPYANFGHLDGYSAIYYTYPWSRAIALDLFTRFRKAGLRDAATARRYRQEVLAPGGARPAQESIEAFLGRPLSLEPLERRLQGSR